MEKPLHIAIFCFALCILSSTGCQLGEDGPISSTLGFRDIPKQSEPPVQTEEEIEAQLSEAKTDE